MNDDLHVMLGRLDALHAVVLTIARSLPPEVAQQSADALQVASERVQADALASPKSDTQLAAMAEVLTGALHVLRSAAQDR